MFEKMFIKLKHLPTGEIYCLPFRQVYIGETILIYDEDGFSIMAELSRVNWEVLQYPRKS